jgi:Chaperone of endosialidase
MSIISAGTTSTTAFKVTSDTTGSLLLKTGASGATAIDIDAAQVVSIGNIAVTGGTINNTIIGGTTAAAGTFTTLTAASTVTLNGGTANGVLYLNGSKVATSGTALVFTGTNLGIGISSPSTKLDLKQSTDNAFSGVRIERSATATQYSVLSSAQGTTYLVGVDTANAGNNVLSFGNSVDGTNYTERMRITSAGDVGIGTSSPGGKLQVSGGRSVFKPTAEQYAIALGRSDFTNTAYIGVANSSSNPDLVFSNNAGTTLATLTDSGNLGLGSTPRAWGSNWRSYDAYGNGAFASSTAGNTSVVVSNGAYNDNTNWKYIYTGIGAALYTQNQNIHEWRIAASGTAGNAITFTQAMTLDASGNLGVGTASPGRLIDAQKDQNSATQFRIRNDNNGTTSQASVTSSYGDFLQYVTMGQYSPSFTSSGLRVANSSGVFTSGNTNGLRVYTIDSAPVIFGTNDTERARITSGGYSKFSNDGTYYGSTSSYHELRQTGTGVGAVVSASNASYANDILYVAASRNTTNNTFYYLSCYNDGGANYRMRVADSGNVTNVNGSYGTISDAKMKTDIVDAGSQWADIKGLRFRKFKMKDDPSGIMQLGVVAQEVEQVSPGLVEEHADRDGDGNDLGTTTKSVKTSILLMKAAVALQEAMARIEKLESEMAALKGLN